MSDTSPELERLLKVRNHIARRVRAMQDAINVERQRLRDERHIERQRELLENPDGIKCGVLRVRYIWQKGENGRAWRLTNCPYPARYGGLCGFHRKGLLRRDRDPKAPAEMVEQVINAARERGLPLDNPSFKTEVAFVDNPVL